MDAQTTTHKLLGKELRFVASTGWNEMYGGIEAGLYIFLANKLLQKFSYDLLVFEFIGGKVQVKISGYHLEDEVLVENKIIFKTKSLHIEKFWMKIDDYPKFYLATFLFPHEY